ncbi:AraC family transcriptional regulator [Leptobacterium flavescens]|uniref:AraC family transcriptional regulator n=1 Tax=Leptobacterium flavescens TaxID=472055 RepID=A0A6P0URN6_9FLAO|nr:GyrI-like domain-containing protein [Leptobacterium flavescens]NER14638.1 AraC family transcriptional regulator [Leptobacterium flavescens]
MKKIASILMLILLGGLLWYLFIKPYDYLVSFKAKTFPGTINQVIKTWNTSFPDAKRVEQDGLERLKQQIVFGDSVHIYKWKIIPLNDSLSRVKVYVKDKDNSFMNKVSIPFSTTDFEKRTKKTLVSFHEKLNEHIGNFRVSISGESQTATTYCAYIPLKGVQIEKARGMMRNYTFISNFLAENKVKLNGKPFVEVTRWDMEKDSIEYNFCYPIIKSDSLPEHELLHYKQMEGKKALKAVYNGNYITSDRAWYALLDYAEKNGIEVDHTPLEVFYSNPNIGGNELEWKAEVFIPIKELQ